VAPRSKIAVSHKDIFKTAFLSNPCVFFLGIVYQTFQGQVQMESQDIGPSDSGRENGQALIFDEDRRKFVEMIID
jgi:hypothetical protein